MNIRILNRDGALPADNWYQIEVPGRHFNAQAKLVQVVDTKAVERIVNRFTQEAAQPNFAGIKIGRDHLSQSLDNPTEALGWLHEVRNRDGIPEGRIEWTSLGRPLIEGKVYKFFSTEYDRPDMEPAGTEKVQNREYPAFRPTRLAGLEVTNDPNNKGGKPISNREERDESQPTKMKTLLKKLGLSEDASEESGLAALEVILNRATAAEGKVTTLIADHAALLAVVVEADLEKFAPVIKNRESVKAALIANRKATVEFLEGLKPAATEQERITNRKEAKTPAELAADKAVKDGEARAAKITNRAGEIRASNKRLTQAQAYSQASAEVDSATAK